MADPIAACHEYQAVIGRVKVGIAPGDTNVDSLRGETMDKITLDEKFKPV
jgi:hypothetical protein